MKDLSYALGMHMASNFRHSGIENLDVTAFAEAMSQIYKGEATRFSAQEAGQIIDEFLIGRAHV